VTVPARTLGRLVAKQIIPLGVRYVRTPAGAKRYGVPIGSPIPLGRRAITPGAPRPPSQEWLRHSLDGATAAERDALRTYSSKRYREINGALRGQTPMTPEIEDIVGNIDSALQRHPLEGPVKLRRAVGPDEFRVPQPSEVFSKLGKAFVEQAYYSTSVDWDWPNRPIYLDVIVPAGVGLFATYMAEVSKFPYQHEVLIQRGMSYRLDTIAYDEDAAVFRGQVTMRKS